MLSMERYRKLTAGGHVMSAGRFIPFSKGLISMGHGDHKSPKDRVVPLPNGRTFVACKSGLLTTYVSGMILQVVNICQAMGSESLM